MSTYSVDIMALHINIGLYRHRQDQARLTSANTENRLSLLMRLVAQNLDREAFAELFDVLAPRIKASLMKAGMDNVAAEDVLQDVMLSIWTKAGLFDPTRGSVFGWAYTIARNARIDRLRRMRPTASLDQMEWDPVDEHDSAEESLVKAGDVTALRGALLSISVEQREIVELAFTQDLTQTEIASRLGLPLGTVKSRLRLAYAHLRKVLET
jgi:RNA polymerase sigma-70 factor (ECF subfamily)